MAVDAGGGAACPPTAFGLEDQHCSAAARALLQSAFTFDDTPLGGIEVGGQRTYSFMLYGVNFTQLFVPNNTINETANSEFQAAARTSFLAGVQGSGAVDVATTYSASTLRLARAEVVHVVPGWFQQLQPADATIVSLLLLAPAGTTAEALLNLSSAVTASPRSFFRDPAWLAAYEPQATPGLVTGQEVEPPPPDSGAMSPALVLGLVAGGSVLGALAAGALLGLLVVKVRERRRAVKLRPSTAYAEPAGAGPGG